MVHAHPSPIPVRLVLSLAAALAALAGAGCSGRSSLAPTAPLFAAPEARRGAGLALDLRDITNEVVVTLAPGADPMQLALDYGAKLRRVEGGQYAAMLPLLGTTADSLVNVISFDARVVTAETNDYVLPAEDRQRSSAFDDGFGSPATYLAQGSTDATGLAAAHRVSKGRGVTIAVLDTGAEMTHPAFTGRIAGGWDFIEGDADASDSGDGLDNDFDGRVDEGRGHGTHVAGIVSLTAPEASLYVVRVLDGEGRGDVLSVAAGIHWAALNGVRVINLSLGMLHMSPAIEHALTVADEGGIVCVGAAGNWGSDSPTEYPGTSPHVLAVAAVNDWDDAASFTSYGPHVALAAPGVDIRSAFTGGTWALWSGTSMAAPFVSGTAALLDALHPGWDRTDVMGRLATSARSLAQRNPALAAHLGAGSLDAGAALAPDDRRVIRGDPPRVE